MQIVLALLTTFGLTLKSGAAPTEGELTQPILLAAIESVCPSRSHASSPIPLSRRQDPGAVRPGQVDAERIGEYLSFHAHAVRGIGVTDVLPGQKPGAASN